MRMLSTGSGLFTGKNGMLVVMLVTSVVLIWLGFMALRLRIAIIRSLGEAASNVLDKFVLPSEGGGGGGSGSLSGALSASGSGGGNGGGGGGAIGQTASATMQSAGATAGSTLTKAAIAGGTVAGGGMLAGKAFAGGNSSGDAHASVATGDGSNGFVSADQTQSMGDVTANGGVSSSGDANAVNGSVDSNAVSGSFESNRQGVLSQEALDKQQAEGLMSATSLASASGAESDATLSAKAGDAGPASGLSVEESEQMAMINGNTSMSDLRQVSAGQAGPVSGVSVGEAAAHAKAEDGSVNGMVNGSVNGDLKGAQAVDGYMVLDADGNMVSASQQAMANASMSGSLSGSMQGNLKGVQGQMRPGELGGSVSASLESAQSGTPSTRDVHGMSVGQAAAHVMASGNPGQARGTLDRGSMQRVPEGQYRQDARSHGVAVPGVPGSAGGKDGLRSVSAGGVSGRDGDVVSGARGMGMQGANASRGLRGEGSPGSDAGRASMYRQGAMSSSTSRYVMPGANSASMRSGGVGANVRGGDAYSRSGAGGGYRPRSSSGSGMSRGARPDRNRAASLNERPNHGDVSVPETRNPGVRGVNVGFGPSGSGGGTPGYFGRERSDGAGSYRQGASDRFV